MAQISREDMEIIANSKSEPGYHHTLFLFLALVSFITGAVIANIFDTTDFLLGVLAVSMCLIPIFLIISFVIHQVDKSHSTNVFLEDWERTGEQPDQSE